MIKIFIALSLISTCSQLANAHPNLGPSEYLCKHDTPVTYNTLEYVNIDPKYLDEIQNTSNHGIFGRSILFDLGTAGKHSGLVMNGFEYAFGGWYGWGLLGDGTEGYFTIASKGDALIASLYTNDTIILIDRPSLASRNLWRVRTSPNGQNYQIGSIEAVASALTGETAQNLATVDHLYIYSTGFEGATGDYNGDSIPNTRDDAVARCMHQIASLNTIYCASLINITARLTYAYESNLDDSWNPGGDLSVINNTGDGVLDEVLLVRELVKADIGTYKRYSGSPSGGGGLAHGYTGNPDKWFNFGSIGSQPDITGNSHEIGHIMGMGHSRGDIVPTLPYAYSLCLPIAERFTLMGRGASAPSCFTSFGGPVILQYSNPDLVFTTNGIDEPMGIDYDLDPLNGADGARTHHESAVGNMKLNRIGIQDFQTGTPSYPDCDGDEILDVIEIAYGTQIDCDNDGVPDACQIANNPEDDCNLNGIPDSCDFTDTRYVTQLEVSTTFGLTGSVTFSNLPTVRSNSYTITFNDNRQYTGIDQIDIYVDSVFVGTVLQGVGSSACGNPKSGSITVSNALNTDITQVEYIATGTDITRGPQFCLSSNWDVQIEYHADSIDDVNRNGIFDPCEPGCTPYDLASPFGQFTYFDLQQFMTWYNNGDLRADFAPPYGQLDYFDVNAYNQGYQAGCP